MGKTRAQIKAYFETGDKPTQAQFADFIDSVPNIQDDGSDIMTIKVSLFPAQIKTMSSIPVLAIAAPGVGKYLSILSADIVYTPVAVSYDGTGSPRLYIDTSANPVFRYTNSFATLLIPVINKMTQGSFGSVGDSQMVENKPLMFSGTSDSTVGDGLITLYIVYRIITL